MFLETAGTPAGTQVFERADRNEVGGACFITARQDCEKSRATQKKTWVARSNKERAKIRPGKNKLSGVIAEVAKFITKREPCQ